MENRLLAVMMAIAIPACIFSNDALAENNRTLKDGAVYHLLTKPGKTQRNSTFKVDKNARTVSLLQNSVINPL